MPPFKILISSATVAVAAIIMMLPGLAQAKTSGGDVQRQIDAQLAAYPGGRQTGPNEVSYKSETVKMVFPNSSQTATCPRGWYCFFQYVNLGGRMLQFHDCGSAQSLENYGFKNKTSSWDNNSQNTVRVYNTDSNPWTGLWLEGPYSRSLDVGTTADNKADLFQTFCAK